MLKVNFDVFIYKCNVFEEFKGFFFLELLISETVALKKKLL